MIITATAKRYAKALFELAQQENRIDETLAELRSFLELVEQEPNVRQLINFPENRERKLIIKKLLQERFSTLLVHFLFLVLKNKRSGLLNQICDDFQARVDQLHNRVRVEVTTALPLPEKKWEQLKREIASYLNAEVSLDRRVDPAILGGIIIRLDGKVFNASLLEQFKKLKQYITQNQK